MKRYLSAAMLLSASILLLPAAPVWLSGKGSAATEEETGEISGTEPASVQEEPGKEDYQADAPYRVLDAASGKIMEVPVREYVIGAVCAEMPASFGEEALKAQAVAAHTYAERQRRRERNSPTPELNGADFSNDTSKYQGYLTEEQVRQYYGSSFDESYKKISDAADQVLPYVITYEDEPIISAFHSMSSGRTESAENAWGAAVDYLVPVDSSFDLSAPKYMETVRYSRDVLREKLETAFSGIALTDDMSSWVTVEDVSGSGTVLSAYAGGRKVTGNELRSALSLRSACFEVCYEGDEALFTTRGFGHGVGMSQYGAAAMAEEGKSWRDILSHYYTGCEITEVK